MTTPSSENVVAAGLARRPVYMQSKEWTDFLEVSLLQIQRIEDAAQDLLDMLPPDVATGDMLVKWGSIFGINKASGWDDATFRRFIKAAARAAVSSGTANELIHIGQTMSPTGVARFFFLGNGVGQILIEGVAESDAELAADIMNRAKAAGERLDTAIAPAAFWGLSTTPGVANPPWNNPLPLSPVRISRAQP